MTKSATDVEVTVSVRVGTTVTTFQRATPTTGDAGPTVRTMLWELVDETDEWTFQTASVNH